MSHRKFYVFVVLAALAMAIGGLACIDTRTDLDKADETYGVT